MFRPMRRKTKEVSIEEARQLLKTERRGVLAVNGDNGYPYAIPVNFYYDETVDKVYFHGAKAGHKVDALKKDDKVCFTVYGNETLPDDPAEQWAPILQSTVIFGRCKMIDDYEQVLPYLRAVAGKFYPSKEEMEEEIAKVGRGCMIYEITIEHISGKRIQEK